MTLPTALPSRLGNSSGAEIYVDFSGGNDTTGTGVIGNPYKTIQKGIDVVNLAGGIINLRTNAVHVCQAGNERFVIQRNASSPVSNPVTIRTYPGDTGQARCEGEFLMGGSGSALFQGWRFHNIEITKKTAQRLGAGAYGIKIENAANIEVFDCYVHHTNQGGLTVVSSVSPFTCDNIQLISNLLAWNGSDDGTGINNHDHGIYWGGGADTNQNGAVYNNIIYEHHYGSGLQVYQGSNQGIFAYNTIYNTDESPADAIGGTTMYMYGPRLTDNVVHSNIYMRNRQDVARNAVEASDTTTTSGNSLKTNLPYDISGALWNSWVGWVNNSTRDADNLSESDPKFQNLAGYDFHLLAESPAIDAGDSAFLPSFDFYGETRITKDIGAVAFLPAAISTQMLRSRRPVGTR